MSRLEEQDFDEKRMARRNKRKRSQLIAYISLAVVVILIVLAIVFGVIFIKSLLGGGKTSDPSEEGDEAATLESSQEIVIETPEAISEPQEMSEEDIMDEVVSDVIETMPIEDKVAGLFIVTPEQLTGVATAVKAGSGTQDALSQYAVGGIVYSAKNIKSEDQITEMLSTTTSMSKYPLFTMVSEWGKGAISSSIGIDGIVDYTDAEAASENGATVAASMYKYGFNFDLSPNMDITENGVFGTDADTVKTVTASLSQALRSEGIWSCAYSFPKQGNTSDKMEQIDDSTEMLATGEYSLFKNVIDDGNVTAIMISNASFPNVVGDNTPASLSSVIIEDELRGVLGFDGIVITGALDDGAITEYYTSDQAAVMAIKAGADMIYLPEDFETAYNGLLEAVNNGEISEERITESLSRIYRIKYADRVEEITKEN
ncbi:beta-N-acetylhexosaminidase [Butyrivibrio sp. Su6]|uniref:glycoside hydrolase family 3 N-terminal domain-containing protein n=1 Tax=Butyrivibrio sp. Su6 TaxID=1520810 RepID=UPI00089F386E|nr:glycoside hydrolase family 3 N-terminal domain-containing protein [Butyrivibrio sp. Su6]SEF97133.1 beta-N-acetylhexosaminidase [Butyrivibrio sp. Su6]